MTEVSIAYIVAAGVFTALGVFFGMTYQLHYIRKHGQVKTKKGTYTFSKTETE